MPNRDDDCRPASASASAKRGLAAQVFSPRPFLFGNSPLTIDDVPFHFRKCRVRRGRIVRPHSAPEREICQLATAPWNVPSRKASPLPLIKRGGNHVPYIGNGIGWHRPLGVCRGAGAGPEGW